MAPNSPDHPGPLHDPPATLQQADLPLIQLPGPWFRIHPMGLSALFFGKTGRNRFDAPAGEYGVLYAGVSEKCAFIETFGQSIGIKFVTEQELRQRGIARIHADRPLTFVNLTGPNLARVGADARLCSGSHTVARQWSKAFHDHPSFPDGLYYRARHDDDEFALALFDRAGDALREEPMGSLADPANSALLAYLLDVYDLGLV